MHFPAPFFTICVLFVLPGRIPGRHVDTVPDTRPDTLDEGAEGRWRTTLAKSCAKLHQICCRSPGILETLFSVSHLRSIIAKPSTNDVPILSLLNNPCKSRDGMQKKSWCDEISFHRARAIIMHWYIGWSGIWRFTEAGCCCCWFVGGGAIV